MFRMFAMLGVVLGMLVLPATAQDSMKTGAHTTQPIGHYDFCKVRPAECQKHAVGPPLELTNAIWARVIRVNRQVNRQVVPVADADNPAYGGQDEVWAYPKGRGDCEDYVLEKRRRLFRSGISLSNLLITVVRQQNGEGHALLTLRTTTGDYILDNLTDVIHPWGATPYKYLKRQDERHAGAWVTIGSGVSALTASKD